MHFECSDGLIREWAAEGRFGAASPGKPPEARLLSLGDRGEEVKSLQETLNAAGASLLVDQIFGRETQSAVMQFQAMNGLTVDGVVGRDTWTELLKVRKAKGLPIAEEVEIAASATRRVATPR